MDANPSDKSQQTRFPSITGLLVTASMSPCVYPCVCPDVPPALPQGGNEPGRGVGGVASVCQCDSLSAGTNSITQRLPAATVAPPCIRLRLGSSRRGDGGSTDAHVVRCTRRDAGRQGAAVSLTRSQPFTCWSHTTLPHTHYLHKSSFKALHVRGSDCCNGQRATFINPHSLKK